MKFVLKMYLITYLAAFILVFTSRCAHAVAPVRQEHSEFLMGGLTYHIFNPNGTAKEYENKLDSSGQLIANPLFAYRHIKLLEDEDYRALTYFGGLNSINEPMIGMAGTIGSTWKWGRLGIIVGAYAQDGDKFRDRGVTPVEYVPHSGWNLAPVFGVEYTHKVTNKVFVNSLLSPIICNFSIGWEI